MRSPLSCPSLPQFPSLFSVGPFPELQSHQISLFVLGLTRSTRMLAPGKQCIWFSACLSPQLLEQAEECYLAQGLLFP